MELVIDPNDILHKRCDIIPTQKQAIAIAPKMLALMEHHNGVGLAAPQVGLEYRMFVCSPDGTALHGIIFINPKITQLLGKSFEDMEGCLSLPNIKVLVKRNPKVKIQYTDIVGKHVELTYSGDMARIIQHEMDHLNGVLITDKAISDISNNYIAA